MEPYSRIKLMRLIVLAGFGLALLYYAIAPGWLVPNTYPHSTFLYNPGDRHHDFWQTYHWTRTLQPYATKQANYFPFTFVAMIPFSILKGLPSLILFLGTIVLFMLRYLHENLPREPRGILQGLNVLTFSVLTYPLLFLLDRANVEGLVLILMVIFFDKYSRGKIRGSLPFLAGAIAMKVYPAFFLVLLVADRRYREVFFTVSWTVAFSLAGLLIFRSFSWDQISSLFAVLRGFDRNFPSVYSTLLHSCSLMSLFRITLSPWINGLLPGDAAVLARIMPYYQGCVLLLAVAVVWYVVKREGVFWKRVAMCTSSVLLFPPVSFDYKLGLLLPLIVLYLREQRRSHFDTVYCIIFALLLIPKTYWAIGTEVTSTSFLTPALLLLLIVMIMLERYEVIAFGGRLSDG